MNVFKSFEVFLSNPLSVIQKRVIRIVHVETNIFAKKMPMDLTLDDTSAQLTVYNNTKVYSLLSNVLYKKRFFDENKHSKIYN